MCQTVILCQKGPTLISQCVECRVINIWHHSILLYFDTEKFQAFRDHTTQLDPLDHTFPFPDGQDRLILHTPNKDINFCFTSTEWDLFRSALDEAGYMQAIYDLTN
jgi:hypothetical protein